MKYDTMIKNLLEAGFLIEKQGVKIFNAQGMLYNYRVDINDSTLKGKLSDGAFQNIDNAIECFNERMEALVFRSATQFLYDIEQELKKRKMNPELISEVRIIQEEGNHVAIIKERYYHRDYTAKSVVDRIQDILNYE